MYGFSFYDVWINGFLAGTMLLVAVTILIQWIKYKNNKENENE